MPATKFSIWRVFKTVVFIVSIFLLCVEYFGFYEVAYLPLERRIQATIWTIVPFFALLLCLPRRQMRLAALLLWGAVGLVVVAPSLLREWTYPSWTREDYLRRVGYSADARQENHPRSDQPQDPAAFRRRGLP